MIILSIKVGLGHRKITTSFTLKILISFLMGKNEQNHNFSFTIKIKLRCFVKRATNVFSDITFLSEFLKQWLLKLRTVICLVKGE